MNLMLIITMMMKVVSLKATVIVQVKRMMSAEYVVEMV